MYTYPWYHWITFFYIYCFFGWIFESTYVSLKSGHFVNRGFLRLPMLPLYGTGAVMMLWFSLPVKDHIVMVYFAGVFAATILEYVTGYVMERLFKMKYWDYSNLKFNLHGYICLSSSVAWGFLTIFLTEVIHKPIAELVLGMNPVIEFTLVAIVSVLFVSDSVQSTREALDLGRALEALTKMRAELEEVQVQIALLKAETNQRMAELKEETSQRVAESIGDAVQRVADMKEGTTQRMAGMKEGTVQRMAGIKEETAQRMAGMKEGTAQRMAGIKEETTQRMAGIKEETTQRMAGIKEETTQRMAGMKEETVQRVADMREGTAQRVAGMREEATLRVAEAAQKIKERTDPEAVLTDRLKALTESRRILSQQMSFYRRSLLRGNPSSSSRFSDALKELKESVESFKNQRKTR